MQHPTAQETTNFYLATVITTYEMPMSSKVHVVHCIDTEGPLYESLEATFERLEHIFGLTFEPSKETLEKLQRGEIDLDGKEEVVQQVVDPELLDYNDTWDRIDEMLDELLSSDFRQQYADSTGNGWIYNWFCVDHVDYDINPRRRTMGYHEIFKHYKRRLDREGHDWDGLHFHYHPHPFRDHAHRCATHWWANSDTLYEVLCRRILDHDWFPAANRPGFQVNRPDSHWFLEQYIPFDYASMATEPSEEAEQQLDFSRGRSGDWRRAPRTWEPYHPSHDDYQSEGDCRRWIARCLNVGTRSYLLDEDDVRQAFREASEGKPVVLSFADHDFRDIRSDVEYVHDLLTTVSAEFEDTGFEYCEAVSGMRRALDIPREPPCDLDVELEQIKDEGHMLTIETETPTFGPQPFFALKTHSDQYYHDNLDFQTPSHKWTYFFDEETFPLQAVEKIGVAANNVYGTTTVTTMDVPSRDVTRTIWNEPTQ